MWFLGNSNENQFFFCRILYRHKDTCLYNLFFGFLMNIFVLTKNFSSHTLMERLKKSYWPEWESNPRPLDLYSYSLPWVKFPLRSIRFFNLSMSVCDEKFFVGIHIYHSDDVILRIFLCLKWPSLRKATKCLLTFSGDFKCPDPMKLQPESHRIAAKIFF